MRIRLPLSALSWHQQLAFLLCLLLLSCGKDESAPWVAVTGTVTLTDQFGVASTATSDIPLQGITVTATTATETYSTTTRTDGSYALKTRAGVQTISFSKQMDFIGEVLGVYKLVDRPIMASEALPLIKLGVRVFRGVHAVRVTPAQDALHVEGMMGEGNRPGFSVLTYRLFFRQGLGPVSATNYALTVPGEVNVGPDQFFLVVTHAQLRAAGLLPGQPITVVAYSDNEFADTYLNPVTKLVVYPAFSESVSNYVTFSY